MDIIDILFRSIFLGFIAWSLFWVFTKKKTLVGHKVEEIDDFVVRTVIVLGIIDITLVASNLIQFNKGFGINPSIQERAFGDYWFGFWMYPITYFGLTQLLWIHKIRQSKVVRIIIALWISMVIHFEKFVIFVTSLHRDFAPGGDRQFPVYILQQVGLSWIIAVLIFTAFVITGLKIKRVIHARI
jgi:molybdopterin-containing oxidoreductase family membrane subunit